MTWKENIEFHWAAVASCAAGSLFWIVLSVLWWIYWGSTPIHSGMVLEIIMVSAATIVPCYVVTIFGFVGALYEFSKHGRRAILAYIGCVLCGAPSFVLVYAIIQEFVIRN